jgi:Methyltransferase domain
VSLWILQDFFALIGHGTPRGARANAPQESIRSGIIKRFTNSIRQAPSHFATSMKLVRQVSSRGGRLLDRLPFCSNGGGRLGDDSRRRHLQPLSKVAASCLLVVGILATNAYYMITTATSTRVTFTSSPETIVTPTSSSDSEVTYAMSPVPKEGPTGSLLSVSLIRDELLAETPWAESHGSDHNLYLGAGMLYYGFAYAFQARTTVVLGSGGGFVPRILKQAQRDLAVAGRYSDGNGGGDLYLIDAHLASAGWGSTFYAENLDTVMRQKYQDINYLFNTTDVAFEILKERGVTSIDYLHIDADHSFAQSYKDFTNYIQLLSPRGVVSFHDTCSDEKRKCRSGVPQTVAKIASELDAWGLQLIDAHYLYRGIAFAIRKSGPALDAPQERRRNFCKNNADRLSKSSVGFTLNKRVGKLDSLGDFYDCNKKFNMSELIGGCATGKFRDGLGRCSLCIPGMVGDDCSRFLYDDARQQEDLSSSSTESRQHQSHLLAAAWLSGLRSKNVLEMGIASAISVTSLLHHPIVSSTVVDPNVERPMWTEIGDRPVIRHLPCKPLDILPGGRYSAVASKPLSEVDAVVCLDCDRRGLPRLDSLLSSIPRARAIVIEGSRISEVIDEFLSARGSGVKASWKVENDLLLTDNRWGQRSRRIVMLVRSP